ncbi:hypothetical protein RUM44_013756 [Polyplax serrata]|uniref:Protein lethal(3)malignant blood neoplasm 1 n=1 Tax=Polyplax serrata TaxID=468196 RepID=A0ABR1BF24_POLSC
MFVKNLLLLLMAVLPLTNCQTADKKSDEERPYKFGFNIQGYQHRQEEKDDKGLIKGEYGFITADGYYRVTVYATDENGDFKILSMKNYYVGFPPEDPTTTPEVPSMNKNRPAVPNPLTVTQTPDTKTYQPLSGRMGCSNCLIPSTTPKSQGGESGFGGSKGVVGTQTGGRGTGSGGHPGSGSYGGAGQTSTHGSQQGKSNVVRGNPLSVQGLAPSDEQDGTKTHSQGDKGRPAIGQVRDGLPPGVTVGDIKSLLYRFNYTVGFHGHHESGYRNGDKEGNYFFDGRDGTERRVEYLANEFGYQPNITFVELQENDERKPNELTEKQYGLKGYEFKWFYRR